MTSIEVNDRYINVKTGVTVQVLDIDGETAKVATVTVTGRLINPRAFKVSSLRADACTAKGALRTSGYIAVHALPEDHPLAPDLDETPEPVVEPAPVNLFTRVDLEGMDDEELFERGRALRAEAALVGAKLDDVKTELKRRKPEARAYVVGNAYLGITTNIRFDAKLAKATLSDKEYAAICSLKPDATLAKNLLSEERYAAICKDHGNKVEVRTATDEDRLKIAEQDAIDEAKAEIDGYSLTVEDPFAVA